MAERAAHGRHLASVGTFLSLEAALRPPRSTTLEQIRIGREECVSQFAPRKLQLDADTLMR